MRWSTERAALAVVLALAALAPAGCGDNAIGVAPFGEQYYYAWDGPGLVCGIAIDDDAYPDLDAIAHAMEWAKQNDQVLVLYGHEPDVILSRRTIRRILEDGEALDLPFVGFDELIDDPTPRAAVALTFDDDFVDSWYGTRDMFRDFDAHVTYFVTRAQDLTGPQLRNLHALRDDGHTIGNHGRRHRKATDYVVEFDVTRYINDEVAGADVQLRLAGFTPRTYAYPFGAYNAEIDAAVAEYAYLRRGNQNCPR
jgi:peptidoglycan/xylan/chitin deacetylase (PgdA/CDA1 family)